MNEESKLTDPKAEEEAANDVLGQSSNAEQDSAEDVESAVSKETESVAAGSAERKKKSKKAKLKKALGVSSKIDGDKDTAGSSSSNPASKLTSGMVEQLLEMNPSLKSEVAGMDKEKATESLKKMDVADLLTGMVRLAEIIGGSYTDTCRTVCERKEPERYGFV